MPSGLWEWLMCVGFFAFVLLAVCCIIWLGREAMRDD